MRPATKKLLGVSAAVAAVLFIGWLLKGAPSEQPRVSAVTASVDEPKAATPAPRVIPPHKPLVARLPAPVVASATQSATLAVDAGSHGAASPAMFGKMVGLVQLFALGEALAKNAAHADAYVDKLCEENRKLSERRPLRQLPPRKQDAAVFMAPLMDYEKPLDQPPGKLHLSDEFRQRINDYGADWPTRIDERDLAGLDFGWLNALAQFDHWSVLAAGRLREHPPDNIYRDAIPNYIGFQVWSKLRLATGLRRGDMLTASTEVRHLADLIRSQQLLIAELIGVTLYRLDAHARTVAKAAGVSVDEWPEAQTEDLASYRNASFGSIYFTYPQVNPETLRKAIGCSPTPCTALLEGAAANQSFGMWTGTNNLSVIRELAAANGCDAALLARTLAGQEIAAGDALEVVGEELPSRIPKFLGPP